MENWVWHLYVELPEAAEQTRDHQLQSKVMQLFYTISSLEMRFVAHLFDIFKYFVICIPVCPHTSYKQKSKSVGNTDAWTKPAVINQSHRQTKLQFNPRILSEPPNVWFYDTWWGQGGGRKWKFFSPVWTAMLQHLAFTKVSGDGR